MDHTNEARTFLSCLHYVAACVPFVPWRYARQYRKKLFVFETRKRREIITICDDMGNRTPTAATQKDVEVSRMQLKIVASCGHCSLKKCVCMLRRHFRLIYGTAVRDHLLIRVIKRSQFLLSEKIEIPRKEGGQGRTYKEQNIIFYALHTTGTKKTISLHLCTYS